jgi:hypothetical protein
MITIQVARDGEEYDEFTWDGTNWRDAMGLTESGPVGTALAQLLAALIAEPYWG